MFIIVFTFDILDLIALRLNILNSEFLTNKLFNSKYLNTRHNSKRPNLKSDLKFASKARKWELNILHRIFSRSLGKYEVNFYYKSYVNVKYRTDITLETLYFYAPHT